MSPVVYALVRPLLFFVVGCLCLVPLVAFGKGDALTDGDRLRITELLARMTQAVDAEDFPSYVAAYAIDGTYETNFAGSARGHVEIAQWLEKMRGGIAGKRHIVANVVIDGTATLAQAKGYLLIVEREGPPAVVATATFSDTLVKVDGRWLVRSHKVVVDPGMFKAQRPAPVDSTSTSR